MTSQKELKTKHSRYGWICYTQSYLSLARIGIEELKGKKHKSLFPFENLSIYKDKHLLIPIIWNFKHGIELILKSLNVCVNKSILKSHNATDIQEFFKKSISDAGLKITKENKIQELAELTIKYYKLEFWHRRVVATRTVFDTQNDVFRYPDNSADFNLDIRQFKTTSPQELEELQKDIRKLNSILGILVSQINRVKNS